MDNVSLRSHFVTYNNTGQHKIQILVQFILHGLCPVVSAIIEFHIIPFCNTVSNEMHKCFNTQV